jgi:hypothetical protein
MIPVADRVLGPERSPDLRRHPMKVLRNQRHRADFVWLGLVLVAVACTQPAAVSRSASAAIATADGQALVGTWVGTSPAQQSDVTMSLLADRTFTWKSSLGDSAGTWQADANTLTFTYTSTTFCPMGSLIWKYKLEGKTLTSDVVGGHCPEGPIRENPLSPDWTFERR